jgi:hypothetical protein
MIVVSVAALVGAGVAVFYSWIYREFACNPTFPSDSESCSGQNALLVIALVDMAAAIAMVAESRRPRGHPWYWFFGGALVFAVWGVVFASLVS